MSLHFDPARVDTFPRAFMAPTGQWQDTQRTQVLDTRIQEAGLRLTDTIEVVRRLAPPLAVTGPREELRLERLFLSVAPPDLAAFKFALEYDGNYKDMVEYLFHDIDDKQRQERILEHFRSAPLQGGIKVLSDVDDTMYANLIDKGPPVMKRCPTEEINDKQLLQLYEGGYRDFSEVTIGQESKEELSRKELIAANFEKAKLTGLYMVGANLAMCNFHGANLSAVNLSEANLSQARLTSANLSGAILYGVNRTDWLIDGIRATHIL